MNAATPHLYALELYLRELRADGATGGTVRTVGLEGALAEVRELRERLVAAEATIETPGSTLPEVEEYIRELRAGGFSGASVTVTTLELLAAEIRGLRRINAKQSGMLARAKLIGYQSAVADEAVAGAASIGPEELERLAGHVRSNTARAIADRLADLLAEHVKYTIERDEMRCMTLVRGSIMVIPPETPAPLALPLPKEIRS